MDILLHPKVLTKDKNCAIIIKLSNGNERKLRKRREIAKTKGYSISKTLKNFQKVLDKEDEVWYNKEVAALKSAAMEESESLHLEN